VKSALDRLERSLKDLIETLNLLKDRGVDFISLKPGLTPPM
jgi:DNA invertase Pin-like site-specific DNA recombinase